MIRIKNAKQNSGVNRLFLQLSEATCWRRHKPDSASTRAGAPSREYGHSAELLGSRFEHEQQGCRRAEYGKKPLQQLSQQLNEVV
ncbi:hypothetical protein P8S55_11025 [Halomonas sp. M1]|uniref:hypothetical protein n=1 Tax=Halomonas sp. M1 TaxID=3035470 RepID=UPI00248546C5|nr:hypothetical protein [Halomonas sp. M1]WFE70321.1 hypothetical protein P8S55_11025 [Halomonas sp. M1]